MYMSIGDGIVGLLADTGMSISITCLVILKEFLVFFLFLVNSRRLLPASSDVIVT